MWTFRLAAEARVPSIRTTGQGGMRPIPGDVIQGIVRNGRTDAGLVRSG